KYWPQNCGYEGKFMEASTPLAFMSRTRSSTSKQPGRISLNRVGSTPYSSGGRPATALRPTLVASCPSNTQASVPSPLVTTRGARLRYRAGMGASNMPGGSTTWSSTETRMRSSMFTRCSSRSDGVGEACAELTQVVIGPTAERAPVEEAPEVEMGVVVPGEPDAAVHLDGGVADRGELAGEGLAAHGREVVVVRRRVVGGPQPPKHAAAGQLDPLVHVDAQVLDGLEAADRLPELPPGL